MDWSDWLAVHFAASSKVDDDFGLSKIAAHFGKQGAVDMYWEGARKEETGDVDGAIALYKRAFRAWPALDSVTDGGLPRGVRDQAKAAGLTDGLLSVVGVAQARSSRVVCSRRLLSAEDIRSVHVVKECVLSFESSLENNPQNATHKQKVGTFLNNPPSYSIQTDAPHVIGKMLRFAFQAWAAEDWSGNSEHPGPLYGITGGIQSLSIRVVEHWEYQVGSGLPDPLHYDTDSVITIVALLSESDDFEGGVFRTNESCGEHLEHRMDQGDTICFISHKYHNITPLTRGVRKSMVIELWQGGIGHTGR